MAEIIKFKRKYSECTKDELLDILDEIEKENVVYDREEEKARNKLKDILVENAGYDRSYLNSLDFDELLDVADECILKPGDEDNYHVLAHLLPECNSLGEENALRDDLVVFVAGVKDDWR